MQRLVSGYVFGDSMYCCCGDEWDAVSLYKAVEEQECRPYKYFLKYYDMTSNRFDGCSRVLDMAHHVKRCFNADLEIPVIFCPNGSLLDGYHRIVKALALDLSFVMAYRLKKMPEPDRTASEER